ncbi:MAG TPA: hypothetical protein VG147_01240 [Solirubrobacteraceae bacterium]|jgi:hypothetical protein|nr:hypothetical protein [Solirubrobacteraceae bacterium]
MTGLVIPTEVDQTVALVEDAIIVVHRGSGGYPTNAFVTSASAEELGLVDGADLNSDIAVADVGSLVAVIVAAYDNETFLIWEPTRAMWAKTRQTIK